MCCLLKEESIDFANFLRDLWIPAFPSQIKISEIDLISANILGVLW